MAEVGLDIGGRHYKVACRDGGEDRLRELARQVDVRARDALRAVGGATETRTLLMTALLLADELYSGEAAPPPPPGVDPALAEALDRVALRLEKLADGLETDVPAS